MKKKTTQSHSAQSCQPAGQDYRDNDREFCPSRIEVQARTQFEKMLSVALHPKLEDLGKLQADTSSAAGHADAPLLCNYGQLEKWLILELFTLGRLLVELFVASARIALRNKRPGSASGRALRRQFKGRFGTIAYWREGSHGHFPLDNLLGIGSGGFSHSVCLLACNLATRISFAGAADVFERFAGWSPDPGSIENMVLGVGVHAASYMEHTAPQRDHSKRQVLVIEIDGKAPPMATEQELEKRSVSAKAVAKAAKAQKQQSADNSAAPAHHTDEGDQSPPCKVGCCCPRHRNRAKATRQSAQEKESAVKMQTDTSIVTSSATNIKTQSESKKDTKSKNGRSATLVVTYVLEEGSDGLLHGPKDKRVWADFGPRVNMMQWAKEDAQRRGFDPQSEDIHLVMDGETCLRDRMRERFPNATIALDIRHAEEHLHDLSKLIDSSAEQTEAFIERYRPMLHDGDIREMTEELQCIIEHANEDKQKSGLDPDDGEYDELEKAIAYFTKRLDMMDYGNLKDKDLVIASGQVEGAARHLVGERMDCGGMRWKVERCRMLLQLRCIGINGEWDRFDDWLSMQNHARLAESGVVRLTSTKPPPMPQAAQAA